MDLKALTHSIFFKSVVTVLVALVIQFIAIRLINFIIHRTVKQSKSESHVDVTKRQNTLIVILRTTFIALLWLAAVFTILSLFGVNVTALLTGAGVISVIFGLSMQNTIRDFLAGMFILFEKQFRVGDTISMSGGTTGFPGISGKVEQITLRITKLRDINGNLVTVRNGDPTIIKNETYSYSSIVLDFTIAYDSDIEAFKKIINDLGNEVAKDNKWKEAVKAPIEFLRVDSFEATGVVVRAIGKVAPASQWEIAGEYRQRLLVAVGKTTKVEFAHS